MSNFVDELTDKQRLFVEHYVSCLNATEAAARAGYQGNRNTLGVTGHENLRNPKIRAAIDARMVDLVIPPNEVLARLSEHGRSTMADFIGIKGRGVTLDLKKAALADKLHLVKKYSKTKQGVSIELYDAQAALQVLAKHYGLLNADDDDWRKALEAMGINAAEFFGQLVERISPAPTEGP